MDASLQLERRLRLRAAGLIARAWRAAREKGAGGTRRVPTTPRLAEGD